MLKQMGLTEIGLIILTIMGYGIAKFLDWNLMAQWSFFSFFQSPQVGKSCANFKLVLENMYGGKIYFSKEISLRVGLQYI